MTNTAAILESGIARSGTLLELTTAGAPVVGVPAGAALQHLHARSCVPLAAADGSADGATLGATEGTPDGVAPELQASSVTARPANLPTMNSWR